MLDNYLKTLDRLQALKVVLKPEDNVLKSKCDRMIMDMLVKIDAELNKKS